MVRFYILERIFCNTKLHEYESLTVSIRKSGDNANPKFTNYRFAP